MNRWLSVRLEAIGASLILGTACFIIIQMKAGEGNAGLAGLALIYITQMLGTLGWGVRQVADTEVRLNSIERLLEYQEDGFPEEAARHLPIDQSLSQWPQSGKIEFKNYQMRYRPELPLALKGLDVVIPPGSRVGVCGRTGSGKSSMMSALFRLVEPAGGQILIDGQDISQIGLSHLRSRLAIIPQDPQLFIGELRNNLDPFESSTDEEIWAALESVRLTEMLNNRQGLKTMVTEGGSNFSLGERQLLCIARALLRRPKLLMLDEATASIDFKTDQLIQEKLRELFQGTTSIVIAHRLDTIMDSTHILVLEEGKVLEFDSPQNLLNSPESSFLAMVEAKGPKAANRLRNLANRPAVEFPVPRDVSEIEQVTEDDGVVVFHPSSLA